MDFINDSRESLIELSINPVFRIALLFVGIWLVRKFGMIFIARAVRKGMRFDKESTTIDERKREDTIITLLDTFVNIGVWIIGIMLVLQELGLEIGPLLAGVSFAGVAVGFGAQSLVKDVVAGIFIIIENQYRVGDVIKVAGVSGVVESITIRETILRNLDGHVHHVPNGMIDVATNLTMEYSNINLNIGVSYDADITEVERAVNKVGLAMLKDKELGQHIINPPSFIRVNNFGASEIEIKIMAKVTPGKQWKLAGEFRRRIKEEFDRSGIEIPYPQHVIHQAKTKRRSTKKTI